jgi:glutathione peroxidase
VDLKEVEMRRVLMIAIAAGGVGAGALGGCAGGGSEWNGGGAGAPEVKPVKKEAFVKGPVHGFTAQTLDGEQVSLDEFRGRTLLIVNVASECGLTPQYEQLEALYRSRRADGLVVLGFPSNDFGGQEPLDNEEIQAFCVDSYDVTFPMFRKAPVTGQAQAPLFAELSKTGGPPSWNFTKYLVDPNGRVVARFDPRTSPMAPEVVEKIDELLGASGTS